MPAILVVDDEWLIRSGLVQMIHRLDPEWTVYEAKSGREAIEHIGRVPVDLVLCDIMMPDMDGLEMLEQLNKQSVRIPVAFLTGYDEFALMRTALRLRAYDYLLKPVHDDDILALLSKFKKDFLPSHNRTGIQETRVQRFEFELVNALDTLQADRVGEVIETGRVRLSDSMTVGEFVERVIRIADRFFARYRLAGLEHELALSTNDMSNLSLIQHAIQLRIHHINASADIRHDKIIHMAKQYIEQHLQRPLTLTEVANHVHFHPTYFSEYFKEKCGETFSRYVMRKKIEKAKQLLDDPVNRIADVAESLGYKDPRSFTKMFKEIVGMTPKQYRQSRP